MAEYIDIASDVSRVEQETSFYCGSACSIMLLRKFGIELDQKTAYDQIHSRERFKTERLYSDPEGISNFLKIKLEGHAPEVIRAASYQDSRSALQGILELLSKRNFPSITLVFKGGHWVVIDALRIVQGSETADRRVIGAFVENPWKNSSPSLYVSFEELQTRYLTPNEYGETWRGKIVVIGPGLSPPAPSFAWMKKVIAGAWNGTRSYFGFSSTPEFSPKLGMILPAPAEFRLDALRREVDRDQVSKGLLLLALDNMAAHGFKDVREIAGGGAGGSSDLRVIEEGSDDQYWIVPMDASDDPIFKDFVLAAISGRTGRLLAVERDVTTLDQFTDGAVGKTATRMFGSSSFKLDPEYYWRSSFMTPSRFDLYRKLVVNGEIFYAIRGGNIVPKLPILSEVGG